MLPKRPVNDLPTFSSKGVFDDDGCPAGDVLRRGCSMSDTNESDAQMHTTPARPLLALSGVSVGRPCLFVRDDDFGGVRYGHSDQ